MFQHYAAFKHLSVFRNVAFGLEIRKRPKAEVERVAELLDLVHLGQFADRLPRSCRAASASAWPSPGRWRWSPRCCCSTSPSARWTPRCARSCATGCGACDEVHVTTVFVTHDQEEALEVADEIVVINDGRIEQVGTPDDLYDRPANDFVMRFLGPVTQLGPDLVRPHDLVLARPRGSAATACGERGRSAGGASASRCGSR